MAKQAHLDERETYTIRLSKDIAERFKKQLNRAHQSITDAGEHAIRAWLDHQEDPSARGVSVDTDKELADSLLENLVSAVTEHLRSTPSWAEAAIRAASLADPAVSVYIQRVHHFHSEKLALSRGFVPWLVRRVLHHIVEGHDVRLIIDSGTTLKAVLDDLGPALAEMLTLHNVEFNRVQIITNNFPGAESYEAFASRAIAGGHALREIIPCQLVPGRALREYAAVVGEMAEKYLRAFCGTATADRPTIRIGLVVGNWILLEDSQTAPRPLARGEGHKSFKDVIFDVSDELYLITPLCKIIVPSAKKSIDENVADFNTDLFGPGTVPGEKGLYEPVALPTDPAVAAKLKVVTTSRESTTSIARAHSLVVGTTLKAMPKDDYMADVGKLIDQLPHFIFAHDAHSQQSFVDQLRAELPHKDTRALAFRRKYFQIAEDR